MHRQSGYIPSPPPAVEPLHIRSRTAVIAVVVWPVQTGAGLRPVRNGSAFRVVTSPECGLVTPGLAAALEALLERFSHGHGFSAGMPLPVSFSRGYQPGSPGHQEGRAIDLIAVAGQSFREWKRQWDHAHADAQRLPAQERADAIAAERRRNLGYRLYTALRDHGGWRLDDHGWRPYRGLVQLFGPWTATEGPWPRDQPTPMQQLDRAWVLRAHQDHIHVAR
jgi:hypothetical protein